MAQFEYEDITPEGATPTFRVYHMVGWGNGDVLGVIKESKGLRFPDIPKHWTAALSFSPDPAHWDKAAIFSHEDREVCAGWLLGIRQTHETKHRNASKAHYEEYIRHITAPGVCPSCGGVVGVATQEIKAIRGGDEMKCGSCGVELVRHDKDETRFQKPLWQVK